MLKCANVKNTKCLTIVQNDSKKEELKESEEMLRLHFPQFAELRKTKKEIVQYLQKSH